MSKAREIVLRLVAEGKITVEEAEEVLDGINGGIGMSYTDQPHAGEAHVHVCLEI